MGIYDREYYRDPSGALRWFSGPAPATRTLIALNVAVYLLQVLAPSLRLEEHLGATSSGILEQFRIYQPFTAPFLHSTGNVLHLVWNMLFLWWFGSELEAMLGSREFSLFYITAAVVSTLAWAVVDRLIPGTSGRMIGASGAVTAVAVVITLFYPQRKILLFFVIPMPLWAFLVLFLGSDALALLQQLQGASGENVAFASHLSGALLGLIYKQSGIRLERFTMPRFRPRLRIVVPERPEPVRPRTPSNVARVEIARGPRESGTAPRGEDQLEAQLDEILAKIAREGRDALTDSEKRILEEASRRARLRRGARP